VLLVIFQHDSANEGPVTGNGFGLVTNEEITNTSPTFALSEKSPLMSVTIQHFTLIFTVAPIIGFVIAAMTLPVILFAPWLPLKRDA